MRGQMIRYGKFPMLRISPSMPAVFLSEHRKVSHRLPLHNGWIYYISVSKSMEKTMCKRTILWITLSIIGVLFNCGNKSTNTPTAQTPSGKVVQGKLVDASGHPVSGASIRIYRYDFIPSISLSKSLAAAAVDTGVTRSDGTYHLTSPDSGLFNIECLKDTLGVFIDSIRILHDSNSVNVSDKVMNRLGTIKGICHMAGQNDTLQVRVTIYMPGTDKVTLPNIGGAFSFNYVPAGRYQMIFNPTLNQYNVKVIDTTLTAGQTLNLDTVPLLAYVPDTVQINTASVSGVWGPNQIVIVNNTITISQGQQLTIYPGTKVLFMGEFWINVWGTLKAIGDSNNPVLFSYGIPSQAATWVGFYSYPPSISIFKNCTIEKCSDGFYSQRPDSLNISNCLFKNCINGIMLSGSNMHQYSITNCIFQNLSSSCIGIRSANPSVF